MQDPSPASGLTEQPVIILKPECDQKRASIADGNRLPVAIVAARGMVVATGPNSTTRLLCTTNMSQSCTEQPARIIYLGRHRSDVWKQPHVRGTFGEGSSLTGRPGHATTAAN